MSGSSSRVALNGPSLTHSAFTVPFETNEKNSGSLKYDIVAVVDPASRDAQRLSQILIVLQHALPCSITVILNPVTEVSDLPLKRSV